MKSLPRLLPFVALFAAASASLFGQAIAPVQRERVQSSYLVAFGRLATDAEVKYWAGQNPKSVAELVTRHREYLSRDAGTHQDTINRSYVTALGKNPNSGEITHWMGGNDTYTTLVSNHVAWLRGNPNEYTEVIKRSYQNVLRRQPTDAEIKYWKGQGVFAYSVLAACHEDFKRRGGDQKAHAATLPTSSSFFHAVAVSAGVLAETKSAIGGGIVAAGGGNIVAAGAGNIVAAGGGNIVAAGAGNIVAAGGGN